MQSLATQDYIVFLLYFVIIVGYAFWIYNRKKKAQTTSNDYFLAEGSLTWWAIGASLIASNISAEQFIGMSGSGFKMGLAIATYEWMAAATLIIVAVFFMPVYLKNKIFTMPQYLHKRYNSNVAMIMAVFWLLLYVLVNLTSILYLGALAISSISGLNITLCMIFLAFFAVMITLGGMKVIGYTDVIQVAVLIIGGLATIYLALQIVDERINGVASGSVIDGFKTLLGQAPEHFHMILPKPAVTTATIDMPVNLDIQKYVVLPGIAMYFAGQWIVN
uniref:sodium:solute symporter family transporter n=1 Tax=Flavobacterium sp. TaxID=239 RepID=UPI0038D4892E